jgi:hypothetical protein
MNAQNSQNAVMNFLRAEFRREQESGFALLRRTPSTSKRKFIDYFAALNGAEQEALSEALAQVALYLFFPSAPHPSRSGNLAYKRYCDAMVLGWDWKYEDVRTLRLMLAAAEKEPHSRFGRGMTSEIRERIRAIKPVKSTEIRKVVKLALSQLFVPLTVSHEEQFWHYEGLLQGREVCVAIDYAARYRQLEYEISVKDKERGVMLERLNYERVMGLSYAHWDCLEQSNLDQSIALLKNFIIYCAEIPARLPAEYKQEANTKI